MVTDSRPVLLVLTVGGSVAPLRSSLAVCRPDRALFIVSEPQGGQPGSGSEVEKLRDCPGFPPSVSFLPVPADDPDRIFALVLTRLEKEVANGFRVLADYTGGTKSMSGALMMAATMTGACDLRLMAGQRTDLRQVADGTERPVDVSAEALGLGRTLMTVASLVRFRSYAAARAILPAEPAVPAGLPAAWRQRVALWRGWLDVLERWDRFDHAGAFQRVRGDGGADGGLGRALAEAGLLERLRALAEAKREPSAALCEDLWWNAQRRADLSAYDDAVARLYRLAEAAIQARLFAAHGIDTGKVPPERLSETFRNGRPNLSPDPETGCLRLALSDARALLAELEPQSPLPGWWAEGLPEWQSRRNHSILAHGFSPLAAQDWEKARAWFAERAGLLWRDLPGGAEACQLPDVLPAARRRPAVAPLAQSPEDRGVVPTP